VSVSGGGTFIMNGGKISGNGTPSGVRVGGGVYVSGGTFTMTGGEISGNTSGNSEGGGVYVGSATFTMTGGTISGNTTGGSGGGVYTSNWGNFIMSGGTISGNTGGSGGGVYINGLGDRGFTMTGGIISGNTANVHGGGVSLLVSTIFNKSGGIITGYGDDPQNGNVVKNSAGIVLSGRGHAVYYGNGLIGKVRETTVGSDVTLDASKNGAEGGWE